MITVGLEYTQGAVAKWRWYMEENDRTLAVGIFMDRRQHALDALGAAIHSRKLKAHDYQLGTDKPAPAGATPPLKNRASKRGRNAAIR
jgi:hypothetical protein